MTEQDFMIWLSGFLAAVGDKPQQRHWDILISKIKEVDSIDLDTGRSRQLLHDNITKER